MEAMMSRVLGHFQAQRKNLEISHDLVDFSASSFTISVEAQNACRDVETALALRLRYQAVLPDVHKGQDIKTRIASDAKDWEENISLRPLLAEGEAVGGACVSILKNSDGVLYAQGHWDDRIPSYADFIRDRDQVLRFAASGPLKSFTYTRLKLMEHRFECFLQLNKLRELEQTKMDRQDWTKVAKVDTHIHLAAAMTSPMLFEFIQHKLRTCPDDLVSRKDGNEISLKALFESAHLDAENLSMASLDTQADMHTFNRFDNFNNLYNPFGDASLRAVFMKTDSYNKGKYFAELTRDLLRMQEADSSCNIKSEFRLSIYGRNVNEFPLLAEWVDMYDLYSDTNRYLIQIPRLYDVFRASKSIASFAELLDNIFKPLFEATINPSKHKRLVRFLSQVTGFDCVDDESKFDQAMPSHTACHPQHWTQPENPPYAYWLYYLYANIAALNKLRRDRGFHHEFTFRPHCGEAGSATHLVDGFLLATNINHGINLQKQTPLQYIYYLAQVGLAVSPLSNAALFLDYDKGPFAVFFKRGLNVSLSTDDPLQFSCTRYPLIEEYAVAKARMNLSPVDMSEIAANSVRQSGFEHQMKSSFLGQNYYRQGLAGNDVNFSNVPDLRVSYREKCLQEELTFVHHAAAGTGFIVVQREDSLRALAPSSLYAKVSVSHTGSTNRAVKEDLAACSRLVKMLSLRYKYWIPPKHGLSMPLSESFALSALPRRIFWKDGVFHVLASELELCGHDETELSTIRCLTCRMSFCDDCCRVLHKAPKMQGHVFHKLTAVEPLYTFASINEFEADFNDLLKLSHDGPTLSLAKRRLKLLSTKYDAHVLLNGTSEKNLLKKMPKHFINLIKVDNHVHTSSAATAEHLLNFVKRTYHVHKDLEVLQDGTTVGQVIERVSPHGVENITLDSMGMNDGETFGRFDKWNALYLPFQDDLMRQTFLRRENKTNGRLYADLIKEVVSLRDPLVHTELRLTVRGSHASEWHELANWVSSNQLKFPRNAWVVQVPRTFRNLFRQKLVKSFGELLDNLFRPLFKVMLDPSSDLELYHLLYDISGFDSVDDESNAEISGDWPKDPYEWVRDEEPPYGYWLYFLRANLHTLNELKAERFLKPFSLRPHAGATGHQNHMIAAFLLADSITHGLTLVQLPSLQYCFYLAQIGVCQAVLAENALYCKIADSPFYDFFRQGIPLSVSTDNPRAIHLTPEPLMEEFAVVSQTWRLRPTDLAELCRNSILMSGFHEDLKTSWLGENYFVENNPNLSGVPSIRFQYRSEALDEERKFVLESSRTKDFEFSKYSF